MRVEAFQTRLGGVGGLYCHTTGQTGFWAEGVCPELLAISRLLLESKDPMV